MIKEEEEEADEGGGGVNGQDAVGDDQGSSSAGEQEEDGEEEEEEEDEDKNQSVEDRDSDEEEEEEETSLPRKGDRSSVCSAELCGVVCSKSFLVSINLSFIVLGWVLVGCGAWMHIFPESFFYSALISDNPTSPFFVVDRVAVAFIVVGVVVFIIGFLGCCGTCTESVCFLGFYSVMAIVSIGVQILVIILALSFKDKMQSNIQRSFFYQVQNEYNSTAQYTNDTLSFVYRVTVAWDRLQTQLGCCGAVGPGDYRHSVWLNHTTVDDHFVPTSCCRSSSTSGSGDDDVIGGSDAYRRGGDYHCQLDALPYFDDDDDYDEDDNYVNDDNNDDHEPRMNTKGCSVAVFEWLASYLPVITVLFVLDLLQVINLFYACCLMKDIRQKISEYSWCEEFEDMS